MSKLLDLSTAHISFETDQLLTISDSEPFACPFPGAVYAIEYGYFIYVSEDDEFSSEFDSRYSQEFKDLIKLIRTLGVHNIRLDRDGAIHEGLPIYDW